MIVTPGVSLASTASASPAPPAPPARMKHLPTGTLAAAFAWTVIAVFVVVATIMFRGKRDLAPWAVAIAAALASKWLIGGNWYIVIGGLAGGIYGALRDTHQKKRDVRQS